MDSSDNFLSQVVRRLLSSDTPLREQLVVVPTKRAGTFLQREFIAQLTDAATILPRIVTIDEWITEMSGRVILDNTALISILYEVYAAYLAEQGEAKAETDQMLRLSQTERMLRDFQDMDLALANVEMLLGNLEELDAFDDYSFLTKEECEAIRKFWTTLPKDFFERPQGEAYLHFSVVWREIYKRFNARLTELGMAYRAAAYRLVAERGFTDDDLLKELRRHSGSKISLVSFVGLYNLTPAEQKIIKKLQSADTDALKVQLYWQKVSLDATDEFTDYLYRTIDQNIDLLRGEVIDGGVARVHSPDIHLLSLNSTILQPQVVNSLIDEIIERDPKALEELRIAIVLNDEKTLIPLMKSLKQPTCTSLNVTMGYPLQYTSVATWIRRYLNIFGLVSPSDRELARVKLTCSRLQLWLAAPLTRKLFGELTTALMEQIALHHYAIKASELRKIIEELTKDADEAIRQPLLEILTPSFTGRELLGRVGQLLELLKETSSALEQDADEAAQDEEDEAFDEPIDQVILSEALDQIVRHITQITNLLTSSAGNRLLLDTPQHVAYLLEQLIAVGSIPFEGAPLEGLQVMGFLETRTLTFDYVIMLNVQEGDLPKSSHTTTLIPDLLRRATHMTTYRTEDDTNAYHFYRLIQGAKEVYLLQDTRPKSISSMEPSRYVDQIRYLTGLPLYESAYADPLEARDETVPQITSQDEEVRHYLKQLASGERTFSPSDLITYYKCPYQFYLKKIKGVGEPQPEPGVVTPIELGSIVHEYLERFYKGLVQKAGDVITRNQLEHKVSRQTLIDIYKEIVSDKSVPDEILLTDLERYIYKALEIDRLLLGDSGTLQLLASETKIKNVPFQWNTHTIHMTGQPDRVDKVCGGVCRIVDYKTGTIKKAKKLTELTPKILESWRFQKSNYKLGGYMLQSYLYALLYAQQPEVGLQEVQPTLYSLAPAVSASEGAIYFDKPKDLNAIKEIVFKYLDLLVDPEEEFFQTPIQEICEGCDYKTICGRK